MAKKKCKYTSIGGQALMEGIMMRGPQKTVMAVRRADGTIQTEEVPQKKPTVWNKIPVVRGIFSFIDSMTTGTKTLMRSAEFVMEDEEKKLLEEEDAEKAVPEENLSGKEIKKRAKEEKAKARKQAKIDKKVARITEKYDGRIESLTEAFQSEKSRLDAKLISANDKKKAKLEAVIGKKTDEFESAKSTLCGKRDNEIAIARGEKEDDRLFMQILMGFATVLGFGLAILLFFFLPTWIYTGIIYLLERAGADAVVAFLGSTPIWKSVFEGILKILIFIIYVKLSSRLPEIQRLFSYHGAEHKCIFCYEAGEELTPENARKYKRFHPRCGTSFLIIMMVLGIFVGIFIPGDMFLRPLIKLALIPLIMGVGYELLKMCGRHDNFLTRIISAPGMWMQHLTTIEPDDGQLECAIAALREVIPEKAEDAQL
ncbi:MAG: DUF1385 domain-containing protein [Ruminococcaceae bacterium]|nr:DUF1385 domain-containing protein [Oscillospiraceae bacterium]